MKLKQLLLVPFILGSLLATAQEDPKQREKEPHNATEKSLNKVMAQKLDTIIKEVSLIFIGDVMGHGSQIRGAYYDSFYDYKPVFKYIKPVIASADIAVANLELTHAGPPYKGYPQFSSPDSLSAALKWAGVDMLVTANNHSCDRRKQGVERTITVLNKYDIPHTGTFKNKAERDSMTPLIMEKNGITIGFLNYTYGTNGIPATPPNIVNLIDKEQIKKDIAKAKAKKVDAIIVVTHWGIEYQMTANQEQKDIAKFCFEQGATMVIGSHPHVVQEFERYNYPDSSGKEVFVCYSLGNFVSNQNDINSRGGAMARVTLKKVITNNDTTTVIGDANYILTFVHRPIEKGVKRFYVVAPHGLAVNHVSADKKEDYPMIELLDDSSWFQNKTQYNEMRTFVTKYEKHLNKVNTNVSAEPVLKYEEEFEWEWNFGNNDTSSLGHKYTDPGLIMPSFPKTDSVYHIEVAAGQHDHLFSRKICKSVLDKRDETEEGNNVKTMILGPFESRKEAERYIRDNECLKGFRVSIKAKAKP